MKKLLVLVFALTLVLALVGCGDPEPTYDGLDTSVEGRVDLLLWSGHF